MFFSRKNKQETIDIVPNTCSEAPAAMQPQEEPKNLSIDVFKKKEKFKMDYEVLISKNTSINGNININGCTRIDGNIDGTLAVNSDLFIGEAGNIRAAVYTQNAIIAGTVNGNISCRERLELKGTAKVNGDIKCKTLIINEGAIFHGKCMGIEEDDAVVKTPEEEYVTEA